MKERVIAILAGFLYRLVAVTWRYEMLDPGAEDARTLRAVLSGESSAAILFAHGEMFPLWYHLRKTRGVPVVSRSRDGERLVAMLRIACRYDRFIRGSSSTGGREVLNEMTETLKERSILVTPDGPRGPAGEAKPGGIVAAYRVGTPVVVVVAEVSRSIRLKTWDSMIIPVPFSTVYIRYCITTTHSESEIDSTIRHVSDLISHETDSLNVDIIQNSAT